jgi:6-phosphogluconate dehydrogenase (decarboxylating)
VLAVKVKGDQTAYLQRVKQIMAIQKRLETGATTRVWRATAAGQDTGTIYVGIEYANLEAYAKGITKLQADEEYNKLQKELQTSGLREVISNSQLVELTP